MINLVTDYFQKKRERDLFSFEYNLLPKLISHFYALHETGLISNYAGVLVCGGLI